MSEKVEIYDVTPRDGDQAANVNLSADDKLWIAKQDDLFGIDGVEAGYPLSNPADREVFERLRDTKLEYVLHAAFGMTRQKRVSVEHDKGLNVLLKSKAPWITIVGKSSRFQVQKVLETTEETNRAMISESLDYLRSEADPSRLTFDAEHFFDAYKEDPRHALSVLEAAQKGRADTLVLCDTNGGSFPEEITQAVKEVREVFSKLTIGIHAHNDGGLAIANTLAAVEAGALHVQGTWNGYGERTGNADLFSVIANLKRKGYEVPDTSTFTAFSREVDRVAKQRVDKRRPFVGSSAFSHKGGMHASGVARNNGAYEFIDPSMVGNRRIILGSKQAGRSNVKIITKRSTLLDEKTKEEVLTNTQLQDCVLNLIKEQESNGYTYDRADASLELLVLKALDKFEPIIVEVTRPKINDIVGGDTEATIKVRVNGSGEVFHVVAEGGGPLGALTTALKKAMLQKFPQLEKMHLTDYSSEIPSAQEDTAAKVQVLMEFSDGENSWTTTGVSEDSTEAGWIAVKEGIEYKLLKDALASQEEAEETTNNA
ncbi:citramalate synthase [Patescibacteria group bacterium]|nr:citramalate synthase [Patescibacteria group bacterium]